MKKSLRIENIKPNFCHQGEGGFTLQIIGSQQVPWDAKVKAFWISEDGNNEKQLEVEVTPSAPNAGHIMKVFVPANFIDRIGVFGIKIKDEDGESNTVDFVIRPPKAEIDKIIPSKKNANPNQNEPLAVHLNGKHFLPDVVVLADGEQITCKRFNNCHIQANLPAEFLKQPKRIIITVFNPGINAEETSGELEIVDPTNQQNQNNNSGLPQQSGIAAWFKKHWPTILVWALLAGIIFAIYKGCSGSDKKDDNKKEVKKEEQKRNQVVRNDVGSTFELTPVKGVIDLSQLEPCDVGIVKMKSDDYTWIKPNGIIWQITQWDGDLLWKRSFQKSDGTTETKIDTIKMGQELGLVKDLLLKPVEPTDNFYVSFQRCRGSDCDCVDALELKDLEHVQF